MIEEIKEKYKGEDMDDEEWVAKNFIESKKK